MKKAILLTLLFLKFFAGFSQVQQLEDFCQVFHLPDGKDTTTFVVWGSKEELKKKKPLFFFRQGSRPEPLIETYDGKFYLSFPFPLKPLTDKFHLVMVQKSGTRLVADSTYMEAFNEGMKTGEMALNRNIFVIPHLTNISVPECVRISLDWLAFR
jgi:hypothetical protein